MFQGNRPLFEKNMVLKAELLTAGIEYPEHVLQALYIEYSDGIISGVNVTVLGNELIVNPGIFKYGKAFYYMLEEKRLPYSAWGEEYYLRVRMNEEQRRKEQIIRSSDILLSTEKEIQIDEMELGRFKLKEGARLRQDYKDFSDLVTEHNTFNIIYAAYASINESTLSPCITKYFGKELFHKSSEAVDMAFAMECMKGIVVPKDLIREYVKKRLGKTEMDMESNMGLYRCMEQILRQTEERKEPAGREEVRHRILVD